MAGEGAEDRHGEIQVLRRGHAEAEPFLYSGLKAALRTACGQGRVTVGRMLHTEEGSGERERNHLNKHLR